MPRVLGIEIPGRKRLPFALRYIYGIGSTLAVEVVEKCNFDASKYAQDLTDEEIKLLTQVLQNDYMIEGDLRRDIQQNIRRLISIGSYRGLRHRRGLPVRGQRTSTNARTRKGPKRTVGAVRDKAARKLLRGG